MIKNRPMVIGLLVALLSLLLDQGSKWVMLSVVDIANRSAIEVTGFFDLVMVWNYGISFGLFSDGKSPFIFIGVSAVIMAILLNWLIKTPSLFIASALGLILGGAAGNVIDRLRFGAVADFFDFHLGIYHWPAFNIADSCIFIGVVLLFADSMFKPAQKS
jgi:signal peptidase II